MHLDIYTYDWFFFHKRDINIVGVTVKRERERRPSWGWSRHNGWGGDNPPNKQRNNNNNKNKKKWEFFFLSNFFSEKRRRRRSTWHRRQKKSSDVVCESLTTARVSRDSALNLSAAPSTLIGERFPFMNWKWNHFLLLNSGSTSITIFGTKQFHYVRWFIHQSDSDKWQIVWEDEIFAQSCYPLMFHECLVYYPVCFSVDWTLSNQTNHNC
jgi:hypothetical protein